MYQSGMELYNPYQLAHHGVAATNWIQQLTNWTPVRFILDAGQYFYNTIILRSLAKLYIYGPSVAGVGGWQGNSPETICSHLTRSSAQFWSENLTECYRLISQQFYSWVVVVEFILYLFVFVKCVQLSCRSCCTRK